MSVYGKAPMTAAMKTLLLALTALVLPALAAAQSGPADPATPASYAPVDPQRLSEWTRQLASDQLQGRAPGTEGETRTIAYLIEQFRALGLEPGGENGGWTQTVPLIRTQRAGARRVHHRLARRAADAPLARGHLCQHGARDVPGARSRTRRWSSSAMASPRRSAAGTISAMSISPARSPSSWSTIPISRPAAGDAGRGPLRRPGDDLLWPLDLQVRGGGAARRDRRAGHPRDRGRRLWLEHRPGAGAARITRSSSRQARASRCCCRAGSSATVAVDLFRRAGLDFEAVKRRARVAGFRPIDLGATLSTSLGHAGQPCREPQRHRPPARRAAARRDGDVLRPLGRLRRRAPPTRNGDTIRNGAHDDALGLAGLLEIARNFAKAGPRPQRTLLFAAWTAEESGLLGSEYYARQSALSGRPMVANLTLDTLQIDGAVARRDPDRPGPERSRGPDGAGTPPLQGRRVTPDAQPQRGLFYRADHFPLARSAVCRCCC